MSWPILIGIAVLLATIAASRWLAAHPPYVEITQDAYGEWGWVGSPRTYRNRAAAVLAAETAGYWVEGEGR